MSESMDGRLPGGRLLEGRTALVTGGTNRIGRGIAEVLRERGVAVAVTGLTDVEREEAYAAGFLAYPLDARGHQACDEAAARVTSDLDGLSVLAPNAGVYLQVRITDMTDEDISAIFGVNATDTIHIVQAATAALRESGHGHMVMASSITGNVTGYPGWSHHGVTKTAQMGFVCSAAMELAKDGITIDAVMPGNVVTPGLVALGKKYIWRMAAAVPLRCLGEPRDVGEAVTFLVSDGAHCITDQAIVVGGG